MLEFTNFDLKFKFKIKIILFFQFGRLLKGFILIQISDGLDLVSMSKRCLFNFIKLYNWGKSSTTHFPTQKKVNVITGNHNQNHLFHNNFLYNIRYKMKVQFPIDSIRKSLALRFSQLQKNRIVNVLIVQFHLLQLDMFLPNDVIILVHRFYSETFGHTMLNEVV